MEKAAEVYTRLKARVLGPKMDAAPKANRSSTERDKAEAGKAEETLAREEGPTEKAGGQAAAGEGHAWDPEPHSSRAGTAPQARARMRAGWGAENSQRRGLWRRKRSRSRVLMPEVRELPCAGQVKPGRFLGASDGIMGL